MSIEEYIRRHRNEMDIEKPDLDYIWAGISHSFQKKRNTRFTVLKIAAAIVILIGLSVVLVQQISIKQNQQLILAKIDPNLAEQEKEFQQQIKTYYKVLQQTNYNEELLTTDFKDLEYIDTLIEIYSNDLKQNGPNTRLINSLMDLYQKKIKLLDRMLNEIEKSKKYENDKIDI